MWHSHCQDPSSILGRSTRLIRLFSIAGLHCKIFYILQCSIPARSTLESVPDYIGITDSYAHIPNALQHVELIASDATNSVELSVEVNLWWANSQLGSDIL